ncbi:MAG: nucleotidyltransferase domain-containing protein [Bacteroidota bacterium]|jgi:predicted nucleotidyltransferase
MNNELEFNELMETIARRYSPDKLILFGSRAIGNYNEDSDYDVFVLKSGIESKRKLTQELYKLLIDKSISVDFIVETPENYAKINDNPFMIYNEIAKTGKLIYERE